jgi:hypothetical protein
MGEEGLNGVDLGLFRTDVPVYGARHSVILSILIAVCHHHSSSLTHSLTHSHLHLSYCT